MGKHYEIHLSCSQWNILWKLKKIRISTNSKLCHKTWAFVFSLHMGLQLHLHKCKKPWWGRECKQQTWVWSVCWVTGEVVKASVETSLFLPSFVPHLSPSTLILCPLPFWWKHLSTNFIRQDENRHVTAWERCLKSCHSAIKVANDVLNNISSSSVCKQVTSSSSGSSYFKGETHTEGGVQNQDSHFNLPLLFIFFLGGGGEQFWIWYRIYFTFFSFCVWNM